MLLLEDLGDRRCVDQLVGCEVRDAEVAIDALAKMHAHWWNSDFTQIPWVKSYVDPPYPQIIEAMFKQSWPVAVEIIGDEMAPHIRDYGDRFADLVPWFLTEATQPPITLCHGDYRLDNLFFAVDDDHAPITVLDWQLSFRGSPGYDLGYFMSQSLSTETRRAHQEALIQRYLDGLAAHDVAMDRAPLDDAFRRTVAYCFIYPVVAAGSIEVTSDRMVALVKGMFDRSVTAIDDTEALELLPPASARSSWMDRSYLGNTNRSGRIQGELCRQRRRPPPRRSARRKRPAPRRLARPRRQSRRQ